MKTKSKAKPKAEADKNTSFNLTLQPHIAEAAEQYRKDIGLNATQDVIRIAVATLLKREGYLQSSFINN